LFSIGEQAGLKVKNLAEITGDQFHFAVLGLNIQSQSLISSCFTEKPALFTKKPPENSGGSKRDGLSGNTDTINLFAPVHFAHFHLF
jgi:hypothetical protein